jgi:hypothetical protein
MNEIPAASARNAPPPFLTPSQLMQVFFLLLIFTPFGKYDLPFGPMLQ